MKPHMNQKNPEEPEYYGDPGITSNDAPVPKWLIWTYITLPFWGLLTFYLYWNGSHGFLDRGYWQQLQRASNTTYPQVNYIQIEGQKERQLKEQ